MDSVKLVTVERGSRARPAPVESRKFTRHSARYAQTPGMAEITHHQSARLRLRYLVALLAIALTTGASAADAVVGRDSNAKVRARVVELVNTARATSRKCGNTRYAAAPPLSESEALHDAAAGHARNMARRKFFDHRGVDGTQPKDRVIRAGYQPRLTGENIALGPESAEEVVAGWLDSPGHCANIMEHRFKDIGVGLSVGRGRGKIYWVQNFGSPR
jgi:uncharacterized protein YkwD